jgi:LPS sulfotransferase NodH
VPVNSYFVCGTPRTGSSLLLGLVDSTGVAGHPQAYRRELGLARRSRPNEKSAFDLEE